uniref:AsmA-like C-terminal region-containing protein n=1 Tax=Klebsiella quasipneumoniae TaxID=1463165 RepID=UPI002415C576
HLSLTADQLQWRGMTFTQVKSDISNQLGLLTINQLQGELDGGLISLPGTLDARGETSQASFQPKLDNVEIATILKAFNYSLNLTGKLSLTGDFSGERIDADDFRRGCASGTGEGVLVLRGGKGSIDHCMRGDLARIIQITVVADNLRDIRRGGACQRGLQVA